MVAKLLSFFIHYRVCFFSVKSTCSYFAFTLMYENCLATIEHGVFRHAASVACFLMGGNVGKESNAVFIGHRDCFEITVESVKPIIEKAIHNGIIAFLNGGQGHFDRICAKAVFELKEKYPEIRSYLIIPYEGFKVFDRTLFDEIVSPYPDEFTPHYFRGAIPKRNQIMVDNASVAICYVGHSSKGSAKTLDYAKKKNLKVYNIYEIINNNSY